MVKPLVGKTNATDGKTWRPVRFDRRLKKDKKESQKRRFLS